MTPSFQNPVELAPIENLRRLLLLRWVGVLLQAMVILVAVYFLALDIPLVATLTVLLLLVGVNVISLLYFNKARRISHRVFLSQLLLDVLALTAMLYFTGGASNAFAWFLLVPHTLASTLLPKPYVWLMAVITSAAYSFLMFFFIPIPGPMADMEMAASGHFQQHIMGMWLGFVLVSFLMAYFVADMAHTLRLRSKLLASMREDALKSERLIALASLATGAAHELGTPLGTMDIVAHELGLAFAKENNSVVAEQLETIQKQIKRCKRVLLRITDNINKGEPNEGQACAIDQYLQHILKQWRVSHLDVALETVYEGKSPAPVFISNVSLTHALMNVLDNAARVSPHFVSLKCYWSDKELVVRVLDDGPGIDDQRLKSMGQSMQTSEQAGLGIGLYLTKASIERMGGTIAWSNRQQGGLSVSLTIPLH